MSGVMITRAHRHLSQGVCRRSLTLLLPLCGYSNPPLNPPPPKKPSLYSTYNLSRESQPIMYERFPFSRAPDCSLRGRAGGRGCYSFTSPSSSFSNLLKPVVINQTCNFGPRVCWISLQLNTPAADSTD